MRKVWVPLHARKYEHMKYFEETVVITATINQFNAVIKIFN
jgi:hypothetical protein